MRTMVSLNRRSRNIVTGRRIVMSFCDMVSRPPSAGRVPAEAGTYTLSVRRLLVIEEPRRHVLGIVREILRQRVERAGELDRFLRREVVRRHVGADQDRHVADVAVAVDSE